MRIALAQINTIIGDFENNSSKILEYVNKALEQKAELVVFPEMSLFTYWPQDLLENEYLIDAQIKYIQKIHKQMPKGIRVLFGCVSKTKENRERAYYNSAVLLEKNQKAQYFYKTLIPNYDVFFESRHIASFKEKNPILKMGKYKIGISICEDMWAKDLKNKKFFYPNDPFQVFKNKKLDLLINISASPYEKNKLAVRTNLAKNLSAEHKCPFIYVNAVGGNDEIVYDGSSFVVSAKQQHLQLSSFQEDLQIFDLKNSKAQIFKNKKINEYKNMHDAIVLGIKDFCQKNGIQSVHLGLSGGIDSALVAYFAVQALGSKNVYAIALPSEFNAELSYDLAMDLAKKLDIQIQKFSINEIYKIVKQNIDHNFSIKEFSLVHENIQARIRALILMAYSNARSSMLLQTSNKSEIATGYSTLYGDMCGGLSPIGDLLKTEVYQMAHFINAKEEIIPKGIIQRAPSAELRPNQKDQDSLPDYESLDASINKIMILNKKPSSPVDLRVADLMQKNEFKRWQAAPILKLSPRAFGRGRMYPITKKMKY